MLEKQVEKYLLDQCKKNNILNYKFTSPATSGVPDRILIHKSKVIFVEMKKPNGLGPRALQIMIQKEMTDHGAIVYNIYTKNDVNELINKIIND